MNMLFTLLVGLLIVGLIYWAITQIPLPDPIRKIAIVLLVVVVGIWLIVLTASMLGVSLPR